MTEIQITGATGTPPYSVYVCDQTLSYCYLVTGSTTIPPTFTFNPPPPLDGAVSIIVKIIDSTGCEYFEPFSCPVTPTPTPTYTPTPTPTPTDLCYCITAVNTGMTTGSFYYVDCDGVLIEKIPVPADMTIYVCGSNPTLPDQVSITIGGLCISNSCPDPTPTPTNTPTITPTNTVTPTNTPTITPTPTCVLGNYQITWTGPSFTYTTYSCSGSPSSTSGFGSGSTIVCSSQTPIGSTGGGGIFTVTYLGLCVTPTPTPTPTNTPTITPTNTPTNTPTVTPSSTPTTGFAYLIIEPLTASTSIGNYMYSNSSPQFFGFSNTTQPSANAVDFDNELNLYLDYSGWTSGELPSIITSNVPQVTGGVDSFGNPIVAYNFETVQVSAGTVSTNAWYTWLIPIGLTNFNYQSEIDVSLSNPNIFTSVLTESTISVNTFTYTGSTIPPVTYRVYTTYPSNDFLLDNTLNDIYFRGSVVSP